jgi:ATP-dependent protease ClpP protease subunit
MAGSAAAIIFQGGTHRRQFENSLFYVHRAQGLALGNVDAMREMMGVLGAIDEQIAKSLAVRAGITPQSMLKLMIGTGGKDGTELNADESFRAGFADEVVRIGRRNSRTPARVQAKLDKIGVDNRRYQWQQQVRERIAELSRG